MWRVWPTVDYERRHKRYSKKKLGQLNAILNNLDRFLNVLRAGRKPKPLPYGFLRDEGLGILRISEAGSESKVAATRLYVYPDPDNEILFLLTIGDKSTQSDDIKLCKAYVRKIQADPSLGGMQDDGDEENGDEEDSEAGQDREPEVG